MIPASYALDTASTDELILPCWAIVEANGHQRHAGYLTEVALFGDPWARLDVPPVVGGTGPSDQAVTLLYHRNSLYRITPVDETVARAVAVEARPEVVHVWELPTPAPAEPPI
jgi:hypothetical protein